jgi:hypothetical protein
MIWHAKHRDIDIDYAFADIGETRPPPQEDEAESAATTIDTGVPQ